MKELFRRITADKEWICIFIIGIVVGFLLLPFFYFLLQFFNVLLFAVLYNLTKFLISEKAADKLSEDFLILNVGDEPYDSKEKATIDIVRTLGELLLIIMGAGFVAGEIITSFMAIRFPVLLDIKFETDWLHVNLYYIFRTVINIIQFVILYYLSSKIKRTVVNYLNKEETIIDEYNDYTGMIV